MVWLTSEAEHGEVSHVAIFLAPFFFFFLNCSFPEIQSSVRAGGSGRGSSAQYSAWTISYSLYRNRGRYFNAIKPLNLEDLLICMVTGRVELLWFSRSQTAAASALV